MFERKMFFCLKIYGKFEPSMVFDPSEFEGPRFDLYICKRVPVKCETKWNSSKRNEIYRNETKSKRNEVNFVSFRWISFRFISFRFDFVSHFTGIPIKMRYFSDVSLILNQTDIIFTSFLHFTLFSVKVKTE